MAIKGPIWTVGTLLASRMLRKFLTDEADHATSRWRPWHGAFFAAVAILTDDSQDALGRMSCAQPGPGSPAAQHSTYCRRTWQL